MNVVAVVVAFHAGDELVRCVQALAGQTHPPVAVAVVNNGTNPGVLTRACEVDALVTVLGDGANLGYCGGNNLAFEAYPTADAFFVVNPDALPAVDALGALVDAMSSRPEAAVVGPLLLDGARVEYWGARTDFDRARVWKENYYSGLDADALPLATDSEWVDGAAMLLSGRAVRGLGGFDERLFLFFDEVDLAERARAAGWAVLQCSGARVQHARTSSLSTQALGQYYYFRNLALIVREHSTRRLRAHAWWAARWADRMRRTGRDAARRRALLAAAADARAGRFGGPKSLRP